MDVCVKQTGNIIILFFSILNKKLRERGKEKRFFAPFYTYKMDFLLFTAVINYIKNCATYTHSPHEFV